MKRSLVAGLALVPALLLAETQPAPAPQPAPTAAAPNLEPLVTEGIVQAPVVEIWRVFSTPEGFTRLGVAKADMDFRPGGLIRSSYDPAAALDGENASHTAILAYEPLRFLATRIQRPPKGFPFAEAWRHVWSVISMTDLGDGRTSLRIAMVGYGLDPESQAMREFFRTGNAWVLQKLQSAYATTPAPTGPAHADAPLAPIDIQALVAGDRESVWRTFTTSEGWLAMMGPQVRAKIGTQPGEPFEIWFNVEAPEGQRGSEGCTILSLLPGEMISYTWNAPPKFPFLRQQHTWVVASFEAVSPATTRVRLRHLGFGELAARFPDHRSDAEQVRAYFAAAWPRVLAALGALFAPEPAAPTAAPAR